VLILCRSLVGSWLVSVLVLTIYDLANPCLQKASFQNCYICKQKMGACIQCSNRNCFLAFHVTCGRRARLHMKMKNSSGPGAQLESSGLKALCDRHVPPDWRKENDVCSFLQFWAFCNFLIFRPTINRLILRLKKLRSFMQQTLLGMNGVTPEQRQLRGSALYMRTMYRTTLK
jgi:hypothetical protein